MIEVENKIKIYELNGKEASPTGDFGTISIKSHWNRDEMVVIKIQGFVLITVSGRDLKVALDNAMHTNRF